MANDSVVTQNTLQTFYDNKVYPYLNGATHTGCVPLGTVLPYYGETAPEHFLICDGTEYLKSDYGELATHLLSLTDPTPYQGSDADHFKVPDLRGEFLRGTGTNSHTNQGSGDDVGVHQDATEIIDLMAFSDTNGAGLQANRYQDISGSDWYSSNHDSKIGSSTISGAPVRSSKSSVGTSYIKITTRPTNTSVTYIIAYQNAYIDLALDGFPIDITQPQDGQLLMYDATAGRWVNGGHKYSTNEHIVGTWIDGKPIYEKTISNINISATSTTKTYTIQDLSSISIENLINIKGIVKVGNEIGILSSTYYNDPNWVWSIRFNTNNSILEFLNRTESNLTVNITATIQYTKTTS